jgi:hypothetical protein
MDDEQPAESGLVYGSAFVIGCFVLVEERLNSLQQLLSGGVVEVENEPRWIGQWMRPERVDTGRHGTTRNETGGSVSLAQATRLVT